MRMFGASCTRLSTVDSTTFFQTVVGITRGGAASELTFWRVSGAAQEAGLGGHVSSEIHGFEYKCKEKQARSK